MKKCNIALLIDDDPINNFLSYAVLTRTGIVNAVQIENSGRKALIFLRKYHEETQSLPELIFLDLNMPLMDGFQFLNEFNEEFIHLNDKTEIIILSTTVNEIERSKAANLGVRHCIIKPLTEDIVKELIPGLFRNSFAPEK